MMFLLQWLFLVYGITLVITGSKIFRPLRQLDPIGLLKCPMCVGWWVGFFLSILYHLGPFQDPAFSGTGLHFSPFQNQITPALAGAFSASGWCWIVYVTLVRLGADKL